VASLLAGLALVTLVLKTMFEHKAAQQMLLAQQSGPQSVEMGLLEEEAHKPGVPNSQESRQQI